MNGEIDWSKWLSVLVAGSAMGISLISLFWNIISERARATAKLEIWLRRHFYEGGEDERTKFTLLCRNLSHRSTAIIDVFLKGEEGVLGGRGYKHRIELPKKIGPWGIEQIEFRVKKMMKISCQAF